MLLSLFLWVQGALSLTSVAGQLTTITGQQMSVTGERKFMTGRLLPLAGQLTLATTQLIVFPGQYFPGAGAKSRSGLGRDERPGTRLPGPRNQDTIAAGEVFGQIQVLFFWHRGWRPAATISLGSDQYMPTLCKTRFLGPFCSFLLLIIFAGCHFTPSMVVYSERGRNGLFRHVWV